MIWEGWGERIRLWGSLWVLKINFGVWIMLLRSLCELASDCKSFNSMGFPAIWLLFGKPAVVADSRGSFSNNIAEVIRGGRSLEGSTVFIVILFYIEGFCLFFRVLIASCDMHQITSLRVHLLCPFSVGLKLTPSANLVKWCITSFLVGFGSYSTFVYWTETFGFGAFYGEDSGSNLLVYIKTYFLFCGSSWNE